MLIRISSYHVNVAIRYVYNDNKIEDILFFHYYLKKEILLFSL